ncbi:MAG: DNA modification methylase [Deltaproteobacteria bacterium]
MKIAGYEVHPAAELFSLIEGADFESLVESIKANGLREPIVLLDGLILDGRNRGRACDAAGIKPKTIPFVGGDPWDYVWDKNAERRHLKQGQKGALWVVKEAGKTSDRVRDEANAARSAKAKGNKNASKNSAGSNDPAPSGKRNRGGSKTATTGARKAGVSPATIKRAKHLQAKSPELFAAVCEGRMTLNQANAKVAQAEARDKAEAQARATTERAHLHQGNAGVLLKSLARGSVDLLLTDPPYSTDVEDILGFATWLNHGLRVLKPTGRAYVCVGAYPEELHAYLEVITASEFRERSQVLVWTYRNTMGPKPVHGYKLNWQAILYLWGEDAAPLDCPSLNEQFSVQDINAPDGRQGDRYHAWQKPDELGDRFVRHATKPGDLVVDPFAGTGSFLLSAARLGRRAIGCDISADNLKIAEQRGCVVEKVARCG